VEVEGSGMRISMDGRGKALDNIFIEQFWRTLKQDYVYLHLGGDGRILFKGLRAFIDYYNNSRLHQGIGRIAPVQKFRKAA